MINILVECPELIASVKIGVLDCLEPFKDKYDLNIIFKKTINIKIKDIKNCDLFITVRGCEYITLQFVKIAKKLSKKIIYYLDDDLLNVPIGEACPIEYYNYVIKKNMTKTLSYCDALWGVNDLIRDNYLQYTNNKIWIYNRIGMDIYPYIEKSDNKLRILYAGSTSHQPLVQEILSPVVKSLSEKYYNSVEFTFIGANSGIENIDNVKNIPIIKNYDEYKNFVQRGNFKIGLAVVKDEPFYHCKYYNKFLEYTSINCVGVYTDCKPYTYVVKNNENGLLCDNTYFSWYNAIERLILDKELLNTCRTNAVNYVNEKHNSLVVQNELEEQLIPFLTKSTVNKKYIFIPPIKLIYLSSRLSIIYSEYGTIRGSLELSKKLCKKILKIFKKKIK